MFSWRNKKNIVWISPLICSYDQIVDAIQISTHNICFYKENQGKNIAKALEKSFSGLFLKCTFSIGGTYFTTSFPVILKT